MGLLCTHRAVAKMMFLGRGAGTAEAGSWGVLAPNNFLRYLWSSVRRKVELVSTFRRVLNDLIDDLFDDSVFYCPCMLANFSDDRHKNHLVEIHLKVSFDQWMRTSYLSVSYVLTDFLIGEKLVGEK